MLTEKKEINATFVQDLGTPQQMSFNFPYKCALPMSTPSFTLA